VVVAVVQLQVLLVIFDNDESCRHRLHLLPSDDVVGVDDDDAG
jgi:hypothetical protein